MIVADLHCHTTFSDGRLNASDLVDWYGKSGVRVLAITDHYCDSMTPLGRVARLMNRTLTQDNLSQYLGVLDHEAQRARRQYGLTLISGVEYTWNTFSHHRSAHLLVLSPDASLLKHLTPDLGLESVLLQAKRLGMFTIAAHPLSTGRVEAQTYHFWDSRFRYAEVLDAWECATSDRYFEEVANSGLKTVASSDLHSVNQRKSWRSLMPFSDGRIDAQDVFQCIREGLARPIVHELEALKNWPHLVPRVSAVGT